MNVFGTRKTQELIDRLRAAQLEDGRSDNDKRLLSDAMEALIEASRYWAAVEGALV